MNYLVQTADQLAPLLKAFRHAAGLTQADLAERLGITQQTYARLETDPQVVSLARFLRVLAVLNVQMALGSATASASQPDVKAAKRRAAATAKPATKPGAKPVAAKAAAKSAKKPAAAKPAAKSARKSPAKPPEKPAKKRPANARTSPPIPVISKRERW